MNKGTINPLSRDDLERILETVVTTPTSDEESLLSEV